MPGDGGLIIKHLPYLRRYARALTGSQTRGDEYVRLCLETILEEPNRIGSKDVKLQLFKAFHDAWRAIHKALPADDSDLGEVDWIHHGLAALPPIERQALLLISLEEFSFSETGTILGLSEAETQFLFRKAQQDIDLQASVSVLIIEDEPMIAMELSRIVRDMGHRVCGTAARQQEAVVLAQKTRPALVLADIQLKEGESGITAVQEILKSLGVPIIFVTGFPERLLTGNSVEPAFVIAKPFDPETLRAAIGQALSVVPPEHPEAQEIA